MSTGSIRHNIEITDSADAERFVEALEKAKAESEGVMERIVMEGTPLTLEERLERQANEIRTKEQQIEQLKAKNDHWQEVCADLHIKYGEQIEAQQQEIDKLQQWVNDLQAGMYVNCVYCGHRYGMENDTPVAMADVLKRHIEHCPKHPMSKLKKEIDRLKDENASIRKWNVCEKEQYEQLLESDKRRIELMETVLKNARTALELLHHMNPEEFCFVFEVRCAIDALLGG